MLSDQNKKHSTELGTFRLEKYSDELGSVRLEVKDKYTVDLVPSDFKKNVQHWAGFTEVPTDLFSKIHKLFTSFQDHIIKKNSKTKFDRLLTNSS